MCVCVWGGGGGGYYHLNVRLNCPPKGSFELVVAVISVARRREGKGLGGRNEQGERKGGAGKEGYRIGIWNRKGREGFEIGVGGE